MKDRIRPSERQETRYACRICPRECGVNRLVQRGYCGCGAAVMAARAGLHYYEEPFLSGVRGSGTVFFSGCSLGCVYCQNGQISRDLYGIEISEERLAEIFLEQQDVRRAHNINLVTGTHFLPSIAAALKSAKDQGLRIPVIWNSSGYEKPEYLRQLEGLVDIFLPDLKTLDPDLGARYMNAPDYPDRAKEALACMVEMAGDALFYELSDDHAQESEGEPGDRTATEDGGSNTQREYLLEPALEYEGEGVLMKQGIVVRHLVIPGQTEDAKHVLRYLHDTYGERIWISLMSQYTPVGEFAAGRCSSRTRAADPAQRPGHYEALYPELFRKVTQGEYDEVVDYAIDLGIENCMIQEEDVADDSFIPIFDGAGICKPGDL